MAKYSISQIRSRMPRGAGSQPADSTLVSSLVLGRGKKHRDESRRGSLRGCATGAEYVTELLIWRTK